MKKHCVRFVNSIVLVITELRRVSELCRTTFENRD